MTRRTQSLAIAVGGLVLGALLVFARRPNAAAELLRFDHSKHQAMACEVCHRGVTTRSEATIPGQGLCSKCHNTSPDRSPSGAAIWEAAEKGGRWAWPVSYRLPSHVYFSHRRHVELARLACRECHGDMSSRTTPVTEPLKQLDMNSCLGCHRRMNASIDCAHCHR